MDTNSLTHSLSHPPSHSLTHPSPSLNSSISNELEFERTTTTTTNNKKSTSRRRRRRRRVGDVLTDAAEASDADFACCDEVPATRRNVRVPQLGERIGVRLFVWLCLSMHVGIIYTVSTDVQETVHDAHQPRERNVIWRRGELSGQNIWSVVCR